MEYPLIDTGMGDMPTAVPTMVPPTPKAPQPQDMQGVAFQLLAGMNPVLLGHAENVAKMANEKIRHGDILSHAARGIMPSERVQQIASVSSAPAPQVEDYDTPMIPTGGEGSFAPISPREQLMSQLQELLYGRNDLALKEADPTGMNQAFDNVAGIMGNAPTAPQMQRPRLSDTEQLGSLIAGALGGGFEGAAQAQSAAFQGAGIRANRENQIAQQNFEAENSQWINKLRTAQQIANNQANVFNQAENRNQRQFSNELRLQDGRIARTQQDIEDLDKQIQGFVDNTQKQVSEYTKLRGEMTDADMSHLLEVIKTQEKAQGLPKDYILERMMIAPVGWKSATVRNQERDDTFRENKYTDDKKRIEETGKLRATKLNYDISMGAYKAALTQLKNNGNVEQGDIDTLQTLREELSAKYGFPINFFPIPKLGVSWQRLMAEASGKRQDAAAQRQLGGDLMGQYWKNRTAALEAFDTATEPLKKAFDDIGKEQDALREDQRKAYQKHQESGSSSDQKALDNAISAYRANVNKYQDAKARYEARVGARLRLIEQLDAEKPSDSIFGGQPFDPTSGNPPPLPGGYVMDKPPAPRGGTKPGGLPDPRGGKPNPKDKGKDNAPTPKPQPQVKPPGTPLNAGKGQVGKGKTKFGAYTLNPKK